MSKKSEKNEGEVQDPAQEKEIKKCGIVMPISGFDGYPDTHWVDVKEILTDAIARAGFRADLVSNGNEVGIIQARIVQNLYDNPVVVVDVSGKNPNVMFELGLRLAFDKPTVIVKDDKTNYNFDTSPIEHINYPLTLRHSLIEEFKQTLADKVLSTYNASINNPDHSVFLKHFGKLTPSALGHSEVPAMDYLLKEMGSLRSTVTNFMNNSMSSVDRNIKHDLEEIYVPRGVVMSIKRIMTDFSLTIFQLEEQENFNNIAITLTREHKVSLAVARNFLRGFIKNYSDYV